MRLNLRNWKLKEMGKDLVMDTVVPGDIVKTLYDNKVIDDPFFGLNHLKLREEVLDKDYIYFTSFNIDKSTLSDQEDLFLSFAGIDLISDIYLNGELLGSTKNMFLEYRFDITDKVVEGENKVEVLMHSTTKYMDSLDCKDYFAVFNIPRLLIRKEQCGFGWDWAPNIPGYGIWQDVTVYSESKEKIVDVYSVANAQGEAVFHVEINYTTRSYYDNNGNLVVVEKKHDDYIKISLTNEPNGDFSNATVKKIPVGGRKSFITFKNDNPQLWWPIGYGEHPLYSYKVELERDGEVISVKEGRLGYRTVETEEFPLDDTLLGYAFKVNGKRIFMKGSNWVPVDCFTGCIPDEKYEKLIQQAVDANMNVLRVWGGGIYEKDVFYDLCDEKGVMVWQDFMFACADLPDDNKEWVDNASEECIYQVKRLRNHTSIVHWCGGNEKTGSHGAKMSYGDWFTNIIIAGIVKHYDPSRPFSRQSPWSHTDTSNDITSGESHYGGFEPSLVKGIHNFRQTISEEVISFVSENAVMGPDTRETYERIFPTEKLWPTNEYWHDRLTENPYAAIRMPFVDIEKKYASELYGELTGLDDFIAKGMLMHAELVSSQIDYHRSNKGFTHGFMNWMYCEIWPSSSWATINYYTEPKQVYYAMKKAYRPIHFTFVQNKKGETELVGLNDTLRDVDVSVEYGVKDFAGNVLWSENQNWTLNTCLPAKALMEKDYKKENTYLFVKYTVEGKTFTNVYSWNMWSTAKFESDFVAKKSLLDANTASVKICANRFAKSVFLHFPNNYKYTFSDNYCDVEAGEEVEVIITSNEKINLNELICEDFAMRTAK